MHTTASNTIPAPNVFTLEEKIKYGLISVVVLGAVFFVGRHLLKKEAIKREANKSAEEGSPADYAQRLKMAFENNGVWGTDLEAVRRVLQALRSKEEFKAVIRSYNTGGKNLMLDLKDELQTSEYNEMLAILAAKPEKYKAGQSTGLTAAHYKAWAQRLKAAFEVKTWGVIPYGTDEEAVKAVFVEIPTQQAFKQVAQAYKDVYGDDLIADLKSELGFAELSALNALLDKKPKA